MNQSMARSMPAGGVVVWFQNIVTFALSLFTLPIESIYRHEFGERYFRIITLVASAVLFVVFAYGFAGFGRMFGGGGQPGLFTWLFLLVFLALGVMHRYRIFRRNWYTGPEWHSHASGESWLSQFTTPMRSRLPMFIPIPNATQRYIEPALALVVGLILVAFGSFVGTWLVFAGLALFFKETVKAEILRNAYLDQVDQQIESAATVELLTEGWTDDDSQAAPATSVTRNGYTASIPLPTRTAKQLSDSRSVLRDMFPDEWNRAEKRKV